MSCVMTTPCFWLVCKAVPVRAWLPYWTFECQGLFQTEDLAVAACITDKHVIAPLYLNQPLPDETVKWEGAYYPRVQPRPEPTR